jgi:hypothetical protein
MRIANCQKCGVQTIRVEHIRTGKKALIDTQPSEDGNILVTGDLYEVVPKDERARVLRRGCVLRKNHFATCEYADQFRRSKDQEKTAA